MMKTILPHFKFIILAACFLLAPNLVPNNANAEQLYELKDPQLYVRLDRFEHNGTQFRILASIPPASKNKFPIHAESFVSKDKSKVIVEIPYIELKSSKEAKFKKRKTFTPILKSFAVLKKEMRTWLVATLPTGVEPVVEQKNSRDGKTARINFTLKKTKDYKKSTTTKKKVKKKLVKIPTPIPTPTISVPQAYDTIDTSLEEGSTEEQEDIVSSKYATVIKNINFHPRSTTKGRRIEIAATKLDEYKLSKSRATLVEIEIPNAGVSNESVLLPHFPPMQFEGVNTVIAQKRADAVVIKIYVDSGVTLTPYRKDQSLWLEVKK